MATLRTLQATKRTLKTLSRLEIPREQTRSKISDFFDDFFTFFPHRYACSPLHLPPANFGLRRLHFGAGWRGTRRGESLKPFGSFGVTGFKDAPFPVSHISHSSETNRSLDLSSEEDFFTVEEAFRLGNIAAVELKEHYCNEFRNRIQPSQDLPFNLKEFPYYLNNLTAQQIVDCVRANLNFPELSKFGGSLSSSNRCMLFYGNTGTELYQERLAQAVAKEVNANFLFVDERIMCPMDEEHTKTDEKRYYGKENDKELYKHYHRKKFIVHFQELDDIDFEDAKAEIERKGYIKSKQNEGNLSDEEREGEGEGEGEGTREEESEEESEDVDEYDESELGENERRGDEEGGYGELCSSDEGEDFMGEYDNEVVLVVKRPPHYQPSGWSTLKPDGRDFPPFFGLNIGDRVRYTGYGSSIASDWRMEVLKNGKHLWIHKDSLPILWTSQPNDEEPSDSTPKTKIGTTGRITAFDSNFPGRFCIELDENFVQNEKNGIQVDNQNSNPVVWDVREIQSLENGEIERGDVCREAFFEILSEYSEEKPLVVFFQNCIRWFDKAVPYKKRKSFYERLQKDIDGLENKNVILVGGHISKQEFDEKNSKTGLGLSLPFSKIFSNIVVILPPKDQISLEAYKLALEKDKEFINSRNNIEKLQNILEQNSISCDNLPFISNSALSPQTLEKIAGIARNVYIGGLQNVPELRDGKLILPSYCFEKAIEMAIPKEEPGQPSPKDAAGKDEFEKIVASEVISPSEIKINFEDIGALEEVKTTLTEISILPLKRPELFSRGNLTKPTKGILLFGPPGTGKTLLAKAIATEAGASFISISSSTLTSKWFGEAEKLTRALFSLAKKIAPSIIFIDEVDSLLGARGSSMEHEATRRMRCEFMAAWDGLKSSDSERVQILAATNRPFDLDEAIIRRMPRRIMVPMPDAANRVKILKVILRNENLLSNFDFDEIAKLTEGYSGSDLKNLCIAAAYRPIREYLEEERKEREMPEKLKMFDLREKTKQRETPSAVLRPLTMEDFTRAMVQVGASINQDNQNMMELYRWNEQYGEGGNRKKRTFGFIGA